MFEWAFNGTRRRLASLMEMVVILWMFVFITVVGIRIAAGCICTRRGLFEIHRWWIHWSGRFAATSTVTAIRLMICLESIRSQWQIIRCSRFGFVCHITIILTLSIWTNNRTRSLRLLLVESTVVTATFDAINHTFRVGWCRCCCVR